MKKYLNAAFLLTLLVSTYVSAQDTIRWGNPRYMFNPRIQFTHCPNPLADRNQCWENILMEGINWQLGAGTNSTGSCIVYYASPKNPVTVYGVAIVMDSIDCDSLSLTQFQGTLCQKIGGILTLIDTALASDGIDVNRYCESVVDYGELYEYVKPVYEFYFEHPHIMCDSFYVGTYRPYINSVIFNYHNTMYRTTDSVSNTIMCFDPRVMPNACSTAGYTTRTLPHIYPILQPCAPPEMSLDVVGDWEKVLSWSGDVQDSFQLSVSEYWQNADSGNIYNLTDTTITFLDGQGDVYFAARVRVKCTSNEAKCPADDRWSPWSEPVYFYFGSEMPDTTHIDTTSIDTTSTGLRLVESGNVDVTLTPNPAAERVTVSATGMQSVELLGVDGTVIMRRDGLMQDEYILDLKGLATGVYMVRVSTAKGTATRRLMVQ